MIINVVKGKSKCTLNRTQTNEVNVYILKFKSFVELKTFSQMSNGSILNKGKKNGERDEEEKERSYSFTV